MPIFMDFHDLPEGILAEHVAEMHQADLKIEHKYNCRGLTYWCDEKKRTAFCLIEAPDKQAIIDLHEKAHGAVPQRIIEVNDTIVESFLGRIVDPKKSQNTELNIINDSAFRTLLVVRFKKNKLRTENVDTLSAAIRGYSKSIEHITSTNKGRLVKKGSNSFLLSFTNVTNALDTAVKIQNLHNCVITPDLDFKIGISAGIPVSEKDNIFEDTIQKADYLTFVSEGNIALTQEVNDLYESENHNIPINIDGVKTVTRNNMDFLCQLLDYTKKVWTQSSIGAMDFNANLGMSKSKLYRVMMPILGISPNGFLKEFRLNEALKIMDKQTSNISEIAYETGFSSPTYFSKCFLEAYGILPSVYMKQKNRYQLDK